MILPGQVAVKDDIFYRVSEIAHHAIFTFGLLLFRAFLDHGIHLHKLFEYLAEALVDVQFEFLAT